MTTERLTADLVEDTSELQLTLRISDSRIYAHISGRAPNLTELSHSVKLVDKSMKSLENAIYDNPLLLGDFKSVNIVCDTHNLFLAPAEAESLGSEMSEVMLPDADGELLSDRATDDITIFYRIGTDKYNFLKRTFSYAAIRHSLTDIASCAKTPGLHVECTSDHSINIARADKAGTLTLLNHPEAHCAADYAYHILAALQPGDDVYMKAESDIREQISDLIHRVSPDTKILPPLPN